ncbi:hypothetical protein AUP68_05198 [Ilyonectria robusta]
MEMLKTASCLYILSMHRKCISRVKQSLGRAITQVTLMGALAVFCCWERSCSPRAVEAAAFYPLRDFQRQPDCTRAAGITVAGLYNMNSKPKNESRDFQRPHSNRHRRDDRRRSHKVPFIHQTRQIPVTIGCDRPQGMVTVVTTVLTVAMPEATIRPMRPTITHKILGGVELSGRSSGDWELGGNTTRAQMARNVNGSYYNMIKLLNWKRLLWVSGTPISNSLRGLVTPLDLMWMTMEVDWVPTPDLNAALLYDEQYDPYKPVNRISEQDCIGIFTEQYVEHNPHVEGLKKAYDKHKTLPQSKHGNIRSKQREG